MTMFKSAAVLAAIALIRRSVRIAIGAEHRRRFYRSRGASPSSVSFSPDSRSNARPGPQSHTMEGPRTTATVVPSSCQDWAGKSTPPAPLLPPPSSVRTDTAPMN